MFVQEKHLKLLIMHEMLTVWTELCNVSVEGEYRLSEDKNVNIITDNVAVVKKFEVKVSVAEKSRFGIKHCGGIVFKMGCLVESGEGSGVGGEAHAEGGDEGIEDVVEGVVEVENEDARDVENEDPMEVENEDARDVENEDPVEVEKEDAVDVVDVENEDAWEVDNEDAKDVEVAVELTYLPHTCAIFFINVLFRTPLEKVTGAPN
ncbi:hypothetical protein LR48_Vigan1300s001000 [Vigna angularis]|uniref:Uncharacterized protein n=1 Tax=Phaseolus angularis TaxID=3914 RepID=A0A0L9TIS8_PHAAN|nr:hypothetical protein LR48_Vigan1300s001000 [Vigna angularis]